MCDDVVALTKALRSPDEEIRLEAIAALGKSGSAAAVEPLARLLRNRRQFRIRDAAAGALGQLAHADSVVPLRDALQAQIDSASRGGYPSDGKRAALALGTIGTPEAVEALILVLRRLPVPSAWSAILQGAIIEALAGIDGPATTDGLVELLDVGAPIYRCRALKRLDARGWEPTTPTEHLSVLLACQKYAQLEARAPELLDVILDRYLSVPTEDHRTLGRLLQRQADPRVADLAVRFLFEEDYRLSVCSALTSRVAELNPLFGDFAAPAVHAALAYDCEVIEETTSTTRWANSLATSDAAVATLAALVTPVSSNLLRLVLDKRPVRASTYDSEWGGADEELDLAPQKEVARAALATRGDPPYDPAAYLVDGAMWLSGSSDE